ncbi:hypothetical protein [Roseomonas indoligenes]|uniref:Uncharacterized protein n=1 Tax=Roseomonas indoligenes TaxID=2820811 RepID=A0A940N4W3_9PROT|nr:hypothetical protein [Pararoseomonas indoligenes]MBP0496021.1 hypothetical protein [Pararoseomonas indoligenes]
MAEKTHTGRKSETASRSSFMPPRVGANLSTLDRIPIVFDETDIATILKATNLAIPDDAPAQLASNLSRAGATYALAASQPDCDPPFQRAKWTKPLAQDCERLLRRLNAHPERPDARAFKELAIALEWRDRRPWELDLLRPVRETAEHLGRRVQANELLRKALQTDEQAQLLEQFDPEAITEWAALNSGDKLHDDPIVAALERLVGCLVYLSNASHLATDLYKAAPRKGRELPPDRVLFVTLCRVFERAFERVPGISNNTATGERDGPAVRFCRATVRCLATKLQAMSPEIPDSQVIVKRLKRLANSPEAVAEQIRHALAVDVMRNRFRRRRTGPKDGGNSVN